MNAINHAATALLINRKWPGVPIIPVLLSVQLVEFLWVTFNLLGLEVTTTEPQVRALNDIHLAYMPYSHSIAATAVLAFTVWVFVAKLLNKPTWALALAVAVSSHIVLDLATHVHDIALAPGIESPKFGSGLYGVPLLALVVETIYGIWCWWVFRGSKALLAVIVLFNLAALSFYAPAIPGPEQFLAGHPKIFAAVIGVHIIVGLLAVGIFARSHWRSSECAMDTCQFSVNTFDRLAQAYAQKYLALDTYDAYYRQFCSHLPQQGATVLDVACGPGNVSAFLVRERPDLQVLGIDLAPNMVRLAQAHVPSASFLVHDCRHLVDLGRVFDGIAYAFGLNYLNQEEAEQFFRSLGKVLAPNGVLYLSAMLGSPERSGLQTSSSGDQIYVHYRPRQDIEQLVHSAGLEIVFSDEIASPATASKPTTDVVLIAQRIDA